MCTARFVLDMVGKSDNKFPRDAAHTIPDNLGLSLSSLHTAM